MTFVGRFYWQTKLANFIVRLISPLDSEHEWPLLCQTEAKKSNDNVDLETEASVVVVEVVVVHDGVTDLPSAGEHMKRRMRDGRCRIPVGHGGSLNPDPRSVNVEHKFAHGGSTTPRMIVDYWHPGSDGKRKVALFTQTFVLFHKTWSVSQMFSLKLPATSYKAVVLL